jgi:glyoxylase-like metal-dependent hydrolase (beta-lactamase superfamily II)
MRRFFKVFLVLLTLAGAAVYWLFYDNRPPTSGTFPLDIAALRREAAAMPGDKPVRIEVETMSHTNLPRIAMVAASNWDDVDQVRNSYRLVFADHAMILDTGYDAAGAKATKVDSFDEAAWQRVIAGMAGATQIVVTHEHGDHIGGLLASPNLKQVLARALITPEQFVETPDAQWPNGSRDGFKPFAYQGIRAIAPGVVLIKAAGHTPGSQMIYVQRADGREYLFMGDTASALDNVRLIKIRSRLVTDFMTHDDRTAVFLQSQALNRLSKAEPKIVLIPGHDGAALADVERQGLLTRGFSLTRSAP